MGANKGIKGGQNRMKMAEQRDEKGGNEIAKGGVKWGAKYWAKSGQHDRKEGGKGGSKKAGKSGENRNKMGANRLIQMRKI